MVSAIALEVLRQARAQSVAAQDLEEYAASRAAAAGMGGRCKSGRAVDGRETGLRRAARSEVTVVIDTVSPMAGGAGGKDTSGAAEQARAVSGSGVW